MREWGQSEDLGPEQCSGVSDHCVLGESLCLSHYVLGGIHCIPPSWLEPIRRTVLPSCPCIPWDSEPLGECSCYRAGAWARSREKLEKISILLSFAGYWRADSEALVSLVVTAVMSPLGCQGTSIPSGMHSFICDPGRVLGEWAS